MEVTTIRAHKRAETGKREVNAVRARGGVPAVMYGREGGPQHIVVDEQEMARELRAHHRVFELEVDGSKQPVYLQDVQYDVLSDRPLHVDFLRISMDQPIHLMVELTFIGVPKGTSKGGTLVKDATQLRVASLPAAIPHEIEVKVGNLDVGEELRARDIELPAGVTLDLPPQTLICRVPA
ncbi:MAG: 50S ribosomal protein L25 [Planctomycetes bacterium]|nr:50S ribosomal protein L25 [Planctomycetota bacterium]